MIKNSYKLELDNLVNGHYFALYKNKWAIFNRYKITYGNKTEGLSLIGKFIKLSSAIKKMKNLTEKFR